MIALAKIILAGMNDYGSSQDIIRSGQRDHTISDIYCRFSLRISLDISQIADMSDSVFRCAVSHVVGIEVGSGGCATVAQISLLVYVKTMKPLCKSMNRAGDDDGPIRDGLNDLQVTRDVLLLNVVRR